MKTPCQESVRPGLITQDSLTMMTSGLVAMLDTDLPTGISALAAIRTAPPFTIGDQQGRWLSVVLEVRDGSESESWHDWLRHLPGVENVEVVFVHWDEVDAEVYHAGV